MTKRTRPSVPRIGTARKRIVILGLPPVDAFDVIGPAEVFALANQLSESEPVPYTLELVCSGPNVYLDSETGIGLKGQGIEDDVRKALRRFAGFFDLKWETIDGRPPVLKVDTNLFREIRKELQYTEVLSRMSLINVEKIGESEPITFRKESTSPLDGIRALGMGHVIVGATVGRDLALHGADVLTSGGRSTTEVGRQ